MYILLLLLLLIIIIIVIIIHNSFEGLPIFLKIESNRTY